MKALIKYWVRKFCGFNNHQILGHVNCYHMPHQDEPHIEVPLAMSGKRCVLNIPYSQCRRFIRDAYPFEVITWKDRLLWPCLPVFSFGRLVQMTYTHPLTTLCQFLSARYLYLCAWCKLKWTAFGTKVASAWDRVVCFLAQTPCDGGRRHQSWEINPAWHTATHDLRFGMDPAVPGTESTTITRQVNKDYVSVPYEAIVARLCPCGRWSVERLKEGVEAWSPKASCKREEPLKLSRRSMDNIAKACGLERKPRKSTRRLKSKSRVKAKG